ncbi:unnamed protein product [Caenorhabditis nigoni]
MVMDRSWIQRTKMSGVPDVVTQTSCVGWGSWDHIKKIKERRTRTVGPLEDQWDRGTASEDQENRRTHFNWWLLRLDGFFADVLVALEIEITSTSRQQRLGIVSSKKGRLWCLSSGCRGTSWKNSMVDNDFLLRRGGVVA